MFHKFGDSYQACYLHSGYYTIASNYANDKVMECSYGKRLFNRRPDFHMKKCEISLHHSGPA